MVSFMINYEMIHFGEVLDLVVSDLNVLRNKSELNTYLKAIVLEAHCKSWEIPDGSVKGYNNLYLDIVSYLYDEPEQPTKLDITQMSVFLHGSENVPI